MLKRSLCVKRFKKLTQSNYTFPVLLVMILFVAEIQRTHIDPINSQDSHDIDIVNADKDLEINFQPSTTASTYAANDLSQNLPKPKYSPPKSNLYFFMSTDYLLDGMIGMPNDGLHVSGFEETEDGMYEVYLVGPSTSYSTWMKPLGLPSNQINLGLEHYILSPKERRGKYFYEQSGMGATLQYSYSEQYFSDYNLGVAVNSDELTGILEEYGNAVGDSLSAPNFPNGTDPENMEDYLYALQNWANELDQDISGSSDNFVEALREYSPDSSFRQIPTWSEGVNVPVHQLSYKVWLGQQRRNYESKIGFNDNLRFGLSGNYMHLSGNHYIVNNYLGVGVFFQYSPISFYPSAARAEKAGDYLPPVLDLNVIGGASYNWGVIPEYGFDNQAMLARGYIGLEAKMTFPVNHGLFSRKRWGEAIKKGAGSDINLDDIFE